MIEKIIVIIFLLHNKIVPARKYCDMKVIFSPKANVVSDVFLSSFCLGFINLDEKVSICYATLDLTKTSVCLIMLLVVFYIIHT